MSAGDTPTSLNSLGILAMLGCQRTSTGFRNTRDTISAEGVIGENQGIFLQQPSRLCAVMRTSLGFESFQMIERSEKKAFLPKVVARMFFVSLPPICPQHCSRVKLSVLEQRLCCYSGSVSSEQQYLQYSYLDSIQKSSLQNKFNDLHQQC